MLQLTSDPIGRGRERACYVHPDDPMRAIKIPGDASSPQSRREIAFYRKLERRGVDYSAYIPRFHGLCETNLGTGIVVDLVRDYDGQVSRALNQYLAAGYPLMEFEPYLEELRATFLRDLIIFNHDLTIGALLFRKTSLSRGRLVAIDGLGDTVALDWLDRIPYLVRRKIDRRWRRFRARAEQTREIRAQREAEAALLEQESDHAV